ncbi:MAG: glutamate-1-semialdehyde 2,1-aminomutase [Actinomycetota bacterium]
METRSSALWFERARRVVPGGVSSPVRAFRAVGGVPRFFVRGEGSLVFDVDGNEYVDLVGSWGPMIVGHAHPHVVDRVRTAVEASASFGAPSPNEVLLAEEIIDRVSAVDKVRFVSSGTEAVTTALRLARAATGRSKIVKFAGCYHGHVDALLVEAGSGVATLGLPDSPGVTPGQAGDTIVLTYNNPSELAETFDRFGREIAAVITEAVPANMGVVPPIPGFNRAISEVCRANGSMFIFDEVMTGFRVARDGWWGALRESWTPDLFTFGKVIGGGYPVAAVAGRAEVMDLLAPEGPVYQAGTLSGNPVATAAGLATLELCDDALYRHLDQRASELVDVVGQALSRHGIPHIVQAAGNLFSIFFRDGGVENFGDARNQNTGAFATFFHAMLEEGVSLPPSAFEAWFVSGAHRDRDISVVARAAERAASRLARQQELSQSSKTSGST